MIRFIDLRGQICADDDLPKDKQAPCFAFWCTIHDKFLTVDDEQTWGSKAELVEGYNSCTEVADYPLSRLLPFLTVADWIPENENTECECC